MRHITTGFVMLASLFCGSVVHAGWLGETVTAAWYYPDSATVIETHDVVVDASIELPFGSIVNSGTLLAIDLSDAEIKFEASAGLFFANVDVNGWTFSDTNSTIPDIVGVTLGPMSGNVSALDNSDLSFDANSVFVNLEGVDIIGGGGFWTLEIAFVPEPSSLILATLGFIGIGVWNLRRRGR